MIMRFKSESGQSSTGPSIAILIVLLLVAVSSSPVIDDDLQNRPGTAQGEIVEESPPPNAGEMSSGKEQGVLDFEFAENVFTLKLDLKVENGRRKSPNAVYLASLCAHRGGRMISGVPVNRRGTTTDLIVICG